MPPTTAEQPFVHPLALCESSEVGAGTRIWAFAHIMEGARVGRYCNLGDRCFIESGATVGDRVTIKNGALIWNGVTVENDVFIGPSVVFTNDRYPRSPRMPDVVSRYAHTENWLQSTTVRHGATIGAGAIILCGIEIGSFAVIAAGAVVARNVPAHRVVSGNPAKPVDWACRCGRPLRNEWACSSCRRRYQLQNGSIVAAESSTL